MTPRDEILKAAKRSSEFNVEDNNFWMDPPDDSITIAIGSMEDPGGVWITLKTDGTYTVEPIVP